MPSFDRRSFYAELAPRDRHARLVDHLFILRDCGQLIGTGTNLFSSPFVEIALVGRLGDADGGRERTPRAWTLACRTPSFGRQPRRRGFHGWMLGFRVPPFTLAIDQEELAPMSRPFVANIDDTVAVDALAYRLDDWIDAVWASLAAASRANPASCGSPTSVAALAADAGVAPRTLQRRFRARTGLAPKRLFALQRFDRALKAIASGGDNLADIAVDAGYCDQAHLTADLTRHAGLPPGRFRALARQQCAPDPVRFFKDTKLRERARLVIGNCAEEAQA